MEESEDDDVNEKRFMPRCEVIDKTTPEPDTGNEDVEDPTFFELELLKGPGCMIIFKKIVFAIKNLQTWYIILLVVIGC